MAEMEPNALEQALVDPKNEMRGFEILAEAIEANNGELPEAKIAKKSAKGCKRIVPLRF